MLVISIIAILNPTKVRLLTGMLKRKLMLRFCLKIVSFQHE